MNWYGSRERLQHGRRLCMAAVPGKYWIIACLCLAVVLRLWWLAAIELPLPISDFAAYYQKAVSLLHGQGYAKVDGTLTAHFPPGYPLVLFSIFKLTGISLTAACLGNVLLQVAGVAVVYYLGRTLFTSEAVGRVAMLAWALHPNSIAYTALLASENLFVPATLSGVALLLAARQRAWLAVPAGIVMGVATLTRPQALLLPLLVLACTLPSAWRSRALRALAVRGGVTLALLLATVLPWLIRNYLVFGRPVFTNTGGWNLYIGNNPEANGEYYISPHMMVEMARFPDEAERDRYCQALGMAFLREHPGQALALTPLKFHALYTNDIDGAQWIGDALPPSSPSRARLALMTDLSRRYYSLLIWAFLAALLIVPVRIMCGHWRGGLSWLGIVVVAAFTAVYLLLFGMSRYHLPMLPWMVITIVGALLPVQSEWNRLQ